MGMDFLCFTTYLTWQSFESSLSDRVVKAVLRDNLFGIPFTVFPSKSRMSLWISLFPVKRCIELNLPSSWIGVSLFILDMRAGLTSPDIPMIQRLRPNDFVKLFKGFPLSAYPTNVHVHV